MHEFPYVIAIILCMPRLMTHLIFNAISPQNFKLLEQIFSHIILNVWNSTIFARHKIAMIITFEVFSTPWATFKSKY